MSGLRLNPEQREAVEFGEGPLLVLAGAGSGKTRVLTARAARLIGDGLDPGRLLAVTFTNKAAGEMRERIEGLLGHSTRGLWIGTFHSIAARMLRMEASHTTRTRSFTIYDEDDSIRTLKDVMASVGYDPRSWAPRAVRGRISNAKNALTEPAEYESEAFDLISEVVAKVYPAYQRELVRRNACDFDDLLFETVRLLETVDGVRDRYAARFAHVLVDEYQDTNHAQYRMVKALASRYRNLCVVGDDDQAVYGWRGADIRNILDFEADFPGAHVVRLERNYRSTASILEVANSVISQNLARKPKRLHTQREAGDPIEVVRCGDERAEAAWVSSRIEAGPGARGFNEFAVLYRTNAQSRAFEEAFRRSGIPYRIVGGVPFYERREVKDVIAYLRLLVNPADDVAFLRAVGWPRRGVGAKTLERLEALARVGGEDGEAVEPLAAVAGRVRPEDGIPAAARRGLARFADGLDELRALLPAYSAREALEACVATFGLATTLAEEEDGADRLENVSELFAVADVFEREDVEDAGDEATDLELFLQSVSLRTDLDEADFDGEAVTMITLHNAKGLEFPVVFLGGLEEGLFPLSRAMEQPGGLEEERRLFYVGVTRAMDRLSLTYADQRWRAGMASRSAPSSFIDELPEEHVTPRLAAPRRGRRGARAGPPEPDRSFEWRRSGGRGRTGPPRRFGGQPEAVVPRRTRVRLRRLAGAARAGPRRPRRTSAFRGGRGPPGARLREGSQSRYRIRGCGPEEGRRRLRRIAPGIASRPGNTPVAPALPAVCESPGHDTGPGVTGSRLPAGVPVSEGPGHPGRRRYVPFAAPQSAQQRRRRDEGFLGLLLNDREQRRHLHDALLDEFHHAAGGFARALQRLSHPVRVVPELPRDPPGLVARLLDVVQHRLQAVVEIGDRPRNPSQRLAGLRATGGPRAGGRRGSPARRRSTPPSRRRLRSRMSSLRLLRKTLRGPGQGSIGAGPGGLNRVCPGVCPPPAAGYLGARGGSAGGRNGREEMRCTIGSRAESS